MEYKKIPWVEMMLFASYEFHSIAKSMFPAAPFSDVALNLRDPEDGFLELAAIYPSCGNGHSATCTFTMSNFTSHTMDILKWFVREKFGDRKLEQVRFWINEKPIEGKVDLTIDYNYVN